MLFGKEKDFVLKVVNLVLILWFIGSIIAIQNSVLNLVFEGNMVNYNKAMYCDHSYYESTSVSCTRVIEENNTTNYKQLSLALGNAVIVFGGIFFINRKDMKK